MAQAFVLAKTDCARCDGILNRFVDGFRLPAAFTCR